MHDILLQTIAIMYKGQWPTVSKRRYIVPKWIMVINGRSAIGLLDTVLDTEA